MPDRFTALDAANHPDLLAVLVMLLKLVIASADPYLLKCALTESIAAPCDRNWSRSSRIASSEASPASRLVCTA